MRVQGKELEEGKLEEGKPTGGLSVEKMCQVAVVSRAGYYRSFAERYPGEEEMMVRGGDPEDRGGASTALWIPAGMV
jgi:hypothetical protein